MDAITTLRELRRRGYTATVSAAGPVRLKLRGPGRPPEELEAQVLANRDEIIRLIREDIIVDELEVFGLARQHFGLAKLEEDGAA